MPQLKLKRLAITLFSLGLALLALPVLAASTLSLSPTVVNITQGRTFNLTVAINPQGTADYTVKTELKFPADLLSVQSFSFAPNWMPLAQSGYDATDNTAGSLIKTAGYPAGLTTTTSFGTATFLAKKSGSAVIETGVSSFALDANNQNVLNAVPVQAQVTISALAPASAPKPAPAPSTSPKPASRPAPTPAPAPTVVTPPAQEQPVTPPVVEPTPQPPVEQPAPIPTAAGPSTSGLFAQIGSILSFGTDNTLLAVIVAIIVLGGLGYGTFAIMRRGRKSKTQ